MPDISRFLHVNPLWEEYLDLVEDDELRDLIKKEGGGEVFKYRGYNCLISRNASLAFCGYICIPESDKLYAYSSRESIESLYEGDLPSHGGLTLYKELKGYKVIGFDCEHVGDLTPTNSFNDEGAIYRDFDYVKGVIKNMIDYIIEHK